MKTTGDALLQAILDEPEADDLRLIYADWLEDHGQPERAEFIRLQIADPVPDGVAPEQYPKRQRILWGEWWRKWHGWPETWHPEELAAESIADTRRGFLFRVAAPLDTLLARLPGLLLRHPVEEVRATDRRPKRYPPEDLGPEEWSWWGKSPVVYTESHLPAEIYSHLTGYTNRSWHRFRDYPTEADALAALRRAVLKECRGRAKLLEPSSA